MYAPDRLNIEFVMVIDHSLDHSLDVLMESGN